MSSALDVRTRFLSMVLRKYSFWQFFVPDVVLGNSCDHLDKSLLGNVVAFAERPDESNVSQVDSVSVQAARESVGKEVF